jgi:branched-chain amino acid transport system substrate-binding protein
MKVKLAMAVAAVTLAANAASARTGDGSVKIGVLTDMSSVLADSAGPGSVTAARLAVADFGGTALGKPIEIVFADHQNKPDVGSNIARKWYDEDGVDVIADVPNSGVALAALEVSRSSRKIVLFSGPATSEISGPKCSAYAAQWMYDTYSLAYGTASALVKNGGKSWYFITADYAFGHSMEEDMSRVIEANGGKVVGKVNSPFGTMDYSSFLLQAQASKAAVVGLATGGGDTINAIKQAAEFGIVDSGQKMASGIIFLTDIHALGLPVAQGIEFTSAFYWDQTDETRNWSKRYFDIAKRMPTEDQAGVYSSVLHYLKAVKEVGSTDADKIMAQMRAMPINDAMTHNGKLRIDGRVERDMYLFEVKKPAESKGPWDYYKQLATLPAAEVTNPLVQSECPLVKK